MRSPWPARCEKETVDAEVVNEVMADLDLQKLTWGVPPESPVVSTPYSASSGDGEF